MVNNVYLQGVITVCCAFVSYLRINVDCCLILFYVKIIRIYVVTRCFQVVIQRQRLIYIALYMQIRVINKTYNRLVKVFGVPYELCTYRRFTCRVIVVRRVARTPFITGNCFIWNSIRSTTRGCTVITDCDYRLLTRCYVVCNIEAHRCDTSLIIADLLSVYPYVCRLTDTFKLKEYLCAVSYVRNRKCLSVEKHTSVAAAGIEVCSIKCLQRTGRMRYADSFPFRVIKVLFIKLLALTVNICRYQLLYALLCVLGVKEFPVQIHIVGH